jgi:anti-sigma B factor antagonist
MEMSATAASVSTVSVEGDLTIYTAAGCKSGLLSQVAAQCASVTLDMEKVSELDTAGLQILLVAHGIVVAAGGSMRLVNVQPAVRDVLRLCGTESRWLAPEVVA